MVRLPDDVPNGNIQLEIDKPHVEILDTGETTVWQVMAGVTHAEYEAMQTEPPYVKVGIGFAAMDAGYFSRSPGAEVDGPMQTRELFGYTWSYCARPVGSPELPAGPTGPRRITVDKHHVLVYRAGRELGSLVLPDGSRYVHVIAGKEPLELPEGWQLDTAHVDRELTVRLPAPATVFFFPNGDSYQGPIRGVTSE